LLSYLSLIAFYKEVVGMNTPSDREWREKFYISLSFSNNTTTTRETLICALALAIRIETPAGTRDINITLFKTITRDSNKMIDSFYCRKKYILCHQ